MPGKRTYEAILFDLEGTLVDFQWRLEKAAHEILSVTAGFDINPSEYGDNPDYAKLFNTTRTITQNWTEKKAQRLFAHLDTVYNKYDKDALSRWQLYPDTVKTLKFLSDAGFRMGLVSNVGRVAGSRVLEKFHLLPFFELVISRNDVNFVKPHPEGLESACQQLGLLPETVLFVGDSVNDILPARHLGMPSCFLRIGESQVTQKTDTMADHHISSLYDLTAIMNVQ